MLIKVYGESRKVGIHGYMPTFISKGQNPLETTSPGPALLHPGRWILHRGPEPPQQGRSVFGPVLVVPCVQEAIGELQVGRLPKSVFFLQDIGDSQSIKLLSCGKLLGVSYWSIVLNRCISSNPMKCHEFLSCGKLLGVCKWSIFLKRGISSTLLGFALHEVAASYWGFTVDETLSCGKRLVVCKLSASVSGSFPAS